MDKLIIKSLSADRESKYIEFKSTFDDDSPQDWCEIIKDIIALSNSGGGVILFGLDDMGNPTGYNHRKILDLDPADITNKMSKYLGIQFSEFELMEREKNGCKIALMAIEGHSIPIVFKKPGTYSDGEKGQKTAFKEGSVYFRHGAKSAPGNTEDIRRAFEAELNRVKKSWLSNIGKIVKGSRESEIVLVPKSVGETAGGKAALIRLTNDPAAPVYGTIDFDLTHPYRQKELIKQVKAKLPNNIVFNSYDVTSLWYAHKIGEYPEFHHTPKFGSTQYSDAYVDWIATNTKQNKNFLRNARQTHYALKRRI